MPTPHIEAKKGEISNIVLMPGDPLRAKVIAEKYLDDYELVNSVRGMYAYTGLYKGKRITVMGHGMGMPSMGIYSYELFNIYDVDVIIRMGSCGSHSENYKLGDTVIASGVNTLSNISKQFLNEDIKELEIYDDINDIIIQTAKDNNIELKSAKVTTTDVFDVYFEKIRNDKTVTIAEMEAFALYLMAKLSNKKCACLLTVVNLSYSDESISSEDRETNLNNMIEIALESTLRL